MRAPITDRFRELYGTPPICVARAPGRIEFIGNHTDYNGGTVLGAAVDRELWVAVAPRRDGRRRFHSSLVNETVELGGPELAHQTGAASWINYPLGVIAALPEFGRHAPEGFDLLVDSTLPAGAGLSSSAALELASGLALLAMTNQQLERETLVQLCRHAENHFVGVPCGILDQGVSAFGRTGHLVRIDCRGPVFEQVPFSGGVVLWLFNTHARHALVDGLYRARHQECMAAAAALGVNQLSELQPADLLAARARVDPLLHRRATHVVEEIHRVDSVMLALAQSDLAAVGRLLTASHRSSQHLFENSTPELDFLVDALVGRKHVHGARLTGGGFGGAVMALTAPAFSAEDAAGVGRDYERRFGHLPQILPLQTTDGAGLVSVD